MFTRRFSRSASRRSVHQAVRYASRIHDAPPSFPVVQTCPAPTCGCSPTPVMPEGLPINHNKLLANTLAFSNEQVVICTGQSDWKSRIEEEHDGDNLAADLKELIGGKGEYADPYHSVSIINGSFPSTVPARKAVQSNSAYLFPSFKYIPFLPRVSFDSALALVRGYLQPVNLHPAHGALSPIHKDRLTREPSYQNMLVAVQDVDDVIIMICGHGGRDMRCGVMAPVLQTEFERLLPKFGYKIAEGPVTVDFSVSQESIEAQREQAPASESRLSPTTARIGFVSHIGGHAYAGNVICCIPPSAKGADKQPHPLAGSQIWYGRVEPKHVEGVITQTLRDGKVIADHFRGGVRQGGEVLRL